MPCWLFPLLAAIFLSVFQYAHSIKQERNAMLDEDVLVSEADKAYKTKSCASFKLL